MSESVKKASVKAETETLAEGNAASENISAEEAKKAAAAAIKPKINGDEAHAAYLEEYVPIRLFKDSGKYAGDVFVAVNGERCLIQRGVEVKIKRKFALVLAQSENQDTEAARVAAAFASEYEQARKDFT